MMLVPPTGWPTTSPAARRLSPVNEPPEIATVALTRPRLSGSVIVTLGDNVVIAGDCSSVHAAVVVPSDSVGGTFTAARLTVVVAAVLRLLTPEPSLSTQVTW